MCKRIINFELISHYSEEDSRQHMRYNNGNKTEQREKNI